jgi:hypothetical protein
MQQYDCDVHSWLVFSDWNCHCEEEHQWECMCSFFTVQILPENVDIEELKGVCVHWNNVLWYMYGPYYQFEAAYLSSQSSRATQLINCASEIN